MVNDGTNDQLWEKSNEQKIVDDIILLCLSAIGIHQKSDQLESKKGDTNG